MSAGILTSRAGRLRFISDELGPLISLDPRQLAWLSHSGAPQIASGPKFALHFQQS